NKLAYKDATKLFQDKKFKEAAAEFAKVQSDYLYYEQAQARMARALAASGDFAASRQAVAAYRKFVEENELSQRMTGKQQVRDLAVASVAYNDVWMSYYEARGNKEFSIERDLEKYGVAVAEAEKFLSNSAEDGAAYVPQVLAYLGRLHVDTGSLDKAEQAYSQLKGVEASRASRLASEIFRQYEGQVDGLTEEFSKLIAKDADANQLAAAETDLANARKQLTALGTDYIQSSGKPQLAILVATMQNFEQLGEWEKVDTVAKKTMAIYGPSTDAGEKNVVDKLVRPMVGEALLQQQRFQEAYDMLVKAEEANPQQWELKRQISRALGGWFEFNKETAARVRVPGLDKPVEAYMKYYGDPTDSYRIWATRPDVKKYSLSWYKFMWESYWFAKQAGAKDDKFKATAQSFYNIARSTNDFGNLKQLGPEGLKLFNFFQANRP
ncbi:MAG: hypothetical protein AB8H80_04760, partial [Planctomycetota bacterium]